MTGEAIVGDRRQESPVATSPIAKPGELKGTGFCADILAEAKELALRYLCGRVEQN
jgi:hypothetical protein